MLRALQTLESQSEFPIRNGRRSQLGGIDSSVKVMCAEANLLFREPLAAR